MRFRSERQRYRLSGLGAAALLAFAAAWGCGAQDERAASRSAAAPAAAPESPAHERPVVLFLGDSLTAGYGLTAEEAYPALIQQRIDADGLEFRALNAGVSGDTSAGGRRRIAWLLRQPIAVLVLALGGNDMLRGQDLAALRENLRAIIAETRGRHPDVRTVIAGMRAPANLGRAYGAGFEATFHELARETGATLIPFLLEGVAADPALNQRDGIHPTAEGQRMIADTVWATLEPILNGSTASGAVFEQ
jgi:acyl-CoA thioesterase-1